MKKFIIFAACVLMGGGSYAQLVVDSTGCVGIGTINSPKSLLSMGGVGDTCATSYILGDKNYGLYIDHTPANTVSGQINGIYVCSTYSNSTNYGILSTALGPHGTGSAYGICGRAGLAGNSIGVYGCRRAYAYTKNFAGIYGSTGISDNSFNYPGIYAGYFKGNVRVTDTIFARKYLNLAGTTIAPSPRIVSISSLDNVNSYDILEKLKDVQTLQLTVKEDRSHDEDTMMSEQDKRDNERLNINDTINGEDGEIIETLYSLDALQLEKVYPELVHKDSNGDYNINYTEMVPLLVKCINELSGKIDKLEEALDANNHEVKENTLLVEDKEIDIVQMSQNKPNPFCGSSVIALNIPKDTKTASIIICDLSGKQVKSIPVTERGKTDITVYSNGLTEGMYIYSLIVEGKNAATRQMIIKE